MGGIPHHINVVCHRHQMHWVAQRTHYNVCGILQWHWKITPQVSTWVPLTALCFHLLGDCMHRLACLHCFRRGWLGIWLALAASCSKKSRNKSSMRTMQWTMHSTSLQGCAIFLVLIYLCIDILSPVSFSAWFFCIHSLFHTFLAFHYSALLFATLLPLFLCLPLCCCCHACRHIAAIILASPTLSWLPCFPPLLYAYALCFMLCFTTTCFTPAAHLLLPTSLL